MSFDRTFNSNNKFILGYTNLKSAPSTGGPTVSLNNDDNLVISAQQNGAESSPQENNNNEIKSQHPNTDLINLLETIDHSQEQPVANEETESQAQDDRAMKQVMKQKDSPLSSTTSSDDEAEIEEELDEKQLMQADDDKPEESIGAVHMGESTSQAVKVPIDVTTDEIIKPANAAEEEIVPKNVMPDHTDKDKIPAFDFQKFLKALKSSKCDPIIKYIRSFMKQFAIRNWSIDEQVKLVKDFQVFIVDKYQEVEPNLSAAELDNAREGFEKLIMSRLYTQVFPPALHNTPKLTPSHKAELLQDLKLADHFIKFSWIENKHLDISDELMQNSKSFVELSAKELNKLNSYKSPRDKIICILNCCKVIYGLIRKQNKNSKQEENADTFVPLLIYIILKSRPKHLISNINYIERFRSDLFLNGESMYYLSSLQLAANFILKVDPKLLTIDEAEYHEKVAAVEADLKAKRESREQQKGLLSPVPLLAGKITDERLQNLSPSEILASSANVISQKFNQIFNSDEQEPTPKKAPNDSKLLAKVKKMSIQEHEEQVLSSKKHEEVFANLKSIFPNIEDDILRDIIALKDYNIGDCIDSCLELAG